ncbi:MAG: hypothetical protein JSS24_02215 [Proteobacteria bacterium]|nr:hypothetical protein [Pseudomonadota bacterium]
MNRQVSPDPVIGSFAEAAIFQLRLALALTPLQRLQDLESMIQFNADAEARNPAIKWAAAQLRG